MQRQKIVSYEKKHFHPWNSHDIAQKVANEGKKPFTPSASERRKKENLIELVKKYRRVIL